MAEDSAEFREWLKKEIRNLNSKLTDIHRHLLPATHPHLKKIAPVNDEDHRIAMNEKYCVFTPVDYELLYLNCIATTKHSLLAIMPTITHIENEQGEVVKYDTNEGIFAFCPFPKKVVEAIPVAICIADVSLCQHLPPDLLRLVTDVAVVLVENGPSDGKVAPRRIALPPGVTNFSDKQVVGVSVGTYVTNLFGMLTSHVFVDAQGKYCGYSEMQVQSGTVGDSGTLLLMEHGTEGELGAFAVFTGGEVRGTSRFGDAALLPPMNSLVALKVTCTKPKWVKVEELGKNENGETVTMCRWKKITPLGKGGGVLFEYNGSTVYGVFYKTNTRTVADEFLREYDASRDPEARGTQSTGALGATLTEDETAASEIPASRDESKQQDLSTEAGSHDPEGEWTAVSGKKCRPATQQKPFSDTKRKAKAKSKQGNSSRGNPRNHRC